MFNKINIVILNTIKWVIYGLIATVLSVSAWIATKVIIQYETCQSGAHGFIVELDNRSDLIIYCKGKPYTPLPK